MCRFNVLLLLYTAFTVSECHSPPATTHSPPATTTHWKRDGQPVTLNVGDLKKYLQTTVSTTAYLSIIYRIFIKSHRPEYQRQRAIIY